MMTIKSKIIRLGMYLSGRAPARIQKSKDPYRKSKIDVIKKLSFNKMCLLEYITCHYKSSYFLTYLCLEFLVETLGFRSQD
jgi:hypothetical protein